MYNPECLNINLLDDNIDLFFDNILSQTTNARIIRKINSYKNYCQINTPNKEKLIQLRSQFSKMFFNLENNQKQNWKEIFPFAYELAVKWKT